MLEMTAKAELWLLLLLYYYYYINICRAHLSSKYCSKALSIVSPFSKHDKYEHILKIH